MYCMYERMNVCGQARSYGRRAAQSVTPPELIREAVFLGDWRIFITYTKAFVNLLDASN